MILNKSLILIKFDVLFKFDIVTLFSSFDMYYFKAWIEFLKN
jgi:hypothetical protein